MTNKNVILLKATVKNDSEIDQYIYIYICRGYIEAIREIQQQLQKGNDWAALDDIVVACGRSNPSSTILYLFFNDFLDTQYT